MANDSFKDKAKGAWSKVKGEAKQRAGERMNDDSKMAEGARDKASGEAKKRMGKLKDELQK